MTGKKPGMWEPGDGRGLGLALATIASLVLWAIIGGVAYVVWRQLS